MEITVTVRTDLNLSAVSSQLKTPTKFLNDLQDYRRVSFYETIASGRTPSGKRVAPLTPKYAKQKKKRWGSRPIRVASGDTQASYDSVVSGNTLTETVEGAAVYLQKGTSKMVARPLLPESWGDLSSKEKKEIERLGTEFVEDLINSIGTSSRGQYG